MSKVAKIPSEAAEQTAVARFLDRCGILWLAIPNEGRRSQAEGQRMKARGLKKGAPDILILSPPPRQPDAPGCALEMKRRSGGQLRREQAIWLEALAAQGWVAMVAYGAQDAISWLRSQGYAPRDRRRTPNRDTLGGRIGSGADNRQLEAERLQGTVGRDDASVPIQEGADTPSQPTLRSV